MKVGMSTACFFGKLYNEEALKEIGRLGIKHAEVFFSAQLEYKPDFVSQLKNICNSEGIEMLAVHALPTQFEPQLFSRHERQYAEALGIYENVLNAAAMLNAGVYVFHGPIHLKIARKPNVNINFAAERFSILANMAKERGIKLCFENVHWCWYNMPGFATQLIQRAETDNLFFTLDMKQAAQSGFSAIKYIDDMGEKLAHVHLCDYIIDKEQGVVPELPFNGEADWQQIRQKLVDMGYNGALMLEVYTMNYKNHKELLACYNSVADFFEK